MGSSYFAGQITFHIYLRFQSPPSSFQPGKGIRRSPPTHGALGLRFVSRRAAPPRRLPAALRTLQRRQWRLTEGKSAAALSFLRHGCGSKRGTQNGTLVSGNMNQHLLSPVGLILTHTHMSLSSQSGRSMTSQQRAFDLFESALVVGKTARRLGCAVALRLLGLLFHQSRTLEQKGRRRAWVPETLN